MSIFSIDKTKSLAKTGPEGNPLATANAWL